MSESLVLCYHALSDDWPAALAVRPAEFERQIDLLLERGYRGVTFSQAVAAGAPAKALAITFDDAWASVLERARPVLAARGVPATVFVPTDYPDRADADELGGRGPVAGRPPRRDALPELGGAARARRGGLGDRLPHLLAIRA